jgi:hypothetical protein
VPQGVEFDRRAAGIMPVVDFGVAARSCVFLFSEKLMPILNFTRLGEAVGDHEAEREALRIVTSFDPDAEYHTSSSCLVRAMQMLIAEGKVDPIDVRFTFEGKPIKHDRFGRFLEVPALSSAARSTPSSSGSRRPYMRRLTPRSPRSSRASSRSSARTGSNTTSSHCSSTAQTSSW